MLCTFGLTKEEFVQHSMDAPRDLVRVGIGFDRTLLERIDQRATSMGLTRTAFVVNAAAEKLLELERVDGSAIGTED